MTTRKGMAPATAAETPTAARESRELAEIWFPAGYEPRSVGPPPERDDRDWIVPEGRPAADAPDAALNPRPRSSAAPPNPPKTTAGAQSSAPPAAKAERLRAELQRAERRARDAEQRAERAERALERSRAREAQPPPKPAPSSVPLESRESKPKPAPSPVQRISVPRESREPATPRSAPPKPRPAAESGVDINAATFETLRSLGLSVNQSARLISQRDQRGGFRSLDELDGTWGIPRELIATLKRRCHV